MSNDQSNWISSWDDTTLSGGLNRGYIYITSSLSSDTTVNIFEVDGNITDNTTYYTIPVSYISGSLPSQNEEIVVTFTRSGVQGLQGLQGNQGNQGNQGLQGNQGNQGKLGKQGIQGKQGKEGKEGKEAKDAS